MDKIISKLSATASETSVDDDLADIGEFFMPIDSELIHLVTVNPSVCVYCFKKIIESSTDASRIKHFMGSLLLISFSVTDDYIVKKLKSYISLPYYVQGDRLDSYLVSLTLHCVLAAWPVPAKNEAVEAVRRNLGASNIWETNWSSSVSKVSFHRVVLLEQMASKHSKADAVKAGKDMLEAIKTRFLSLKR